MTPEARDLDRVDEALVKRLRAVLDEAPSPATQRQMRQSLEQFRARLAEQPSAMKLGGILDRQRYKWIGWAAVACALLLCVVWGVRLRWQRPARLPDVEPALVGRSDPSSTSPEESKPMRLVPQDSGNASGQPLPSSVGVGSNFSSRSTCFYSLLDAVLASGRWGYINRAGKVVITPKYSFVRPFSEGLAAVCSGAKWGFIDTEGRLKVPLRYNSAGSFSEGLATVRVHDKWGYIDRNGREVIPIRLKYNCGSFSDGRVLAIERGKWGYLDTHGEYVVPAIYDDAYSFSDGLAAVLKSEKWGYIDREGTYVISPRFNQAQAFREGLAAVSLDGELWGYVDRKGNTVIEPAFEKAPWNWFSGGRALIKRKGRLGFIDTQGKVVIQPKYVEAAPFREGLAHVREAGENPYDGWRFIDTKGNTVLEPAADWWDSSLQEGLLTVRIGAELKTGRWGFMDRSGRMVIPPKFGWARGFSEGLAPIAEGLNWEILDKSLNARQ
jgi:hypothetical protein